MNLKEQAGSDERYNISFSYRSDKIRIYRQIITALENPRFIEFWINPEEKTLYLRGTNTRSLNCLEVPIKKSGEDFCYVLHGRRFIKRVSDLAGWDLETSHKLHGALIMGEQLLKFNLVSTTAM